jgi:glycosyltransferase involved in cell wall biosynthesis
MPCYDEEATVAEILDRVLASPYVAEVVVVDDGSRDRTVEIVETIAATEDRVRLLVQPFNMGKGAALQRGFMEVTQPFVIVQDADLEYDPAEYEKLMEPLLDGRADIVFGSRFQGGAHRVLYFWHAVGNKMLTLASNVMTDLNLTDMETCYKAFRSEVLDSLTLEEARFGIEPEMTAKMAAAGWRIWEVRISYSGRTYAEGKKIGMKDALYALWCVLRYSRLGERLARSRARRAGLELELENYSAGLEPSLEKLDQCANYPDWLSGLILPHLQGRIHEAGAGTGTIARRLASHGELVVSEPDPGFAAALRQTFQNGPVAVVEANLNEAVRVVDADSVVLVNVLEHLEHDDEALRAIFESLPSGGRLVLFVPALDVLYSPTDRQMGHYRRYSRVGLVNKLSSAGFSVLEARYVNMLGAALWFGYARVLGRHPTHDASAGLYDRFLVKPMSRFEASRKARFGQSLLAVAERP